MSRNDLNGEMSNHDRRIAAGGWWPGARSSARAVLPGAADTAERACVRRRNSPHARGRSLAGLDPDKRKLRRLNGTARSGAAELFRLSERDQAGLRLEQMDVAQKDLAWALLATLMSPEGLKKARNVMIIAGRADRARRRRRAAFAERFSFASMEPRATPARGLSA